MLENKNKNKLKRLYIFHVQIFIRQPILLLVGKSDITHGP